MIPSQPSSQKNAGRDGPAKRLRTMSTVQGRLISRNRSRQKFQRSVEFFLNNHKSNSASDSNARDAAIVCSPALQNGVPLETIRPALLRDSQGRPSTPLGCALDIVGEQDTGGAP
jgi:hypothetical protein